jgi:hypothetical protein
MRKPGLLFLLLMVAVLGLAWLPAGAQEDCDSLPPRLASGQSGQVAFTDGQPLNVRASADRSSEVVGLLPEGMAFDVLEGPACADDINWWRIRAGEVTGWIAEAADGVYLVEPRVRALPTARPVALSQGAPFTVWDWATFEGDDYRAGLPDPLALTPPPVYAGDMPTLPVDLDNVLFVADANLSDDQRALLAQNGFVVVPAGLAQFDEAYDEYTEEWSTVPGTFDPLADPATQERGHPIFITTDSMLHALHYIFDNLLTDLEREALIVRVQNVVTLSLNSAIEQYQQALGTALEAPARNAALYLLVSAHLFSSEISIPAGLDKSLLGEADSLVSAALSGEGQLPLSFLPGYLEDFSQYRPRGHYAGDSTLESYFRGMMWLSRITFRANDDAETMTALMLLRALRSAPAAYDDWQTVHDTLSFLIGPVDDLGPPEYAPLADAIFGADLSLANLTDAGRLAMFRERLQSLPGPRINGLVLPDTTEVEDVEAISRGFRLMGQRFTFDAYVLQQLMSPFVGTRENPRPLPLGLDVPAAMGSDSAYTLAAQADATNFLNYDTQMASLRGQIASLTTGNWLENTYSGWLWTLQPLWVRDPAPYPPLMQTEAWLRKDLHTGLASWTELKHDTVLYAKQPTGFGGGGPPLASYGYVEPNPLVFARISVVAALTFQGLTEHGLVDIYNYEATGTGLLTSAGELRALAFNAASFAQMARKELAGEPLTEDEYYDIQTYGTYLNILLRTLYQGEGEPDPVALVTDVASNPGARVVLQEGVGGVDYIYVVIPAPGGRLQVARGAVLSYYEFVGDINRRMTDQEWRALVASDNLPERPRWVSAFVGE